MTGLQHKLSIDFSYDFITHSAKDAEPFIWSLLGCRIFKAPVQEFPSPRENWVPFFAWSQTFGRQASSRHIFGVLVVPSLPAVADEVLVPHPPQRDEVEVER